VNGASIPQPPIVLDGSGRIAADLACINCAYNLRTLPVGGNCPECGHPVAETAAGYLAELDSSGHVAADLSCVNCGYNLRTLLAGAICPECAAPVSRSIGGHYLHAAPARWVRRLSNGAMLLVATIAGSIVLSILGAALMFIVALAAGPTLGTLDALVPILAIVIAVVGLWLIIRGLVDLTARDPAARLRKEGFTARKLVRYCLIVVPALILASMILSAAGAWPRGLNVQPLLSITIPIFMLIALIAYFVLPLAALRHIATLMRRVPRPGLVLFAKIEFWGLLVGGIIYIAGHVFFVFIAFWAAPTFAGGPNMPVPGYAIGPNTPGVVVTRSALPPNTPSTSAPAGSSTVVYNYAEFVPGAGTATSASTTMPTAPPLGMRAPPISPMLFLAPIVMGVSGCIMLALTIAGFVLLILVWRALANAARQAEAIAIPQ
jgi:hypothetical protein